MSSYTLGASSITIVQVSESKNSKADNAYGCPHCDYMTPGKGIWVQHVSQHMKSGREHVKIFHCAYCAYISTSIDLITRHDRRTHSDKDTSGVLSGYVEIEAGQSNVVTVYTCDRCHFRCHNHFGLVDHMKAGIHNVNEEEGATSVKSCGPSPARQEENKTKKPIKRYKCDTCDHTCDREYSMKLHVTTHKKCKAAPVFYRCARCGYDGKYKYIVVQHSRKAHPDETAMTILVKKDGTMIPQEPETWSPPRTPGDVDSVSSCGDVDSRGFSEPREVPQKTRVTRRSMGRDRSQAITFNPMNKPLNVEGRGESENAFV